MSKLSRSILFILLFSVTSISLLNAQDDKMSEHWGYFLKFQEHQEGELNDSALYYLNKASETAFEIGNHNRYLWYMNETGRYLYIKGYPLKAIDTIKNGMSKYREHNDTSSVMYSYCYNGIGFIYYSQNKLKKASRYFIRNVTQTENLLEKGIYYNDSRKRTISQLIDVYTTIVTCYTSLYEKSNDPDFFYLATEYAEKAWRMLKRENFKEGYSGIIKSYAELVEIAYPVEVIRLMELEKDLHKKSEYTLYYKNLGNYFALQNKADKAINWLKKAYKIQKSLNDVTTSEVITTGGSSIYGFKNMIANVYLQKGMTDTAISMYNKSIHSSEDSLIMSESFRGLAKGHIAHGELEKADSLYKKAFQFINKNKETATYNEYMLEWAIVKIKMKRPEEAINLTMKATKVQEQKNTFESQSPHSGNLSFILNNTLTKARIYAELYIQNRNEKDYEKSRLLFSEGLTLANELNYKLVNKVSLAYLSKNIKKYLPYFVEANYRKYKETGDEQYIGLIIDALANNTSRTLNTLIRKADIRKGAKRQTNTYRKIDSLELKINQLQTALLSNTDTLKTDTLQRKKLDATIELLALKFKRDRRKNHKAPDYARNTGEKVQELLDKKSLLVDYYIVDSILFTIGITKKGYTIDRQILPNEFPKIVKGKKRAIKTGRATFKSDKILSEVLLNPLHRKMRQKSHLIIIPDDYLFDVPFETLIHKGKLLIKSHAVSYQYSTLIHTINNSGKNREGLSSLILAPDFKQKGNYENQLAYRGASNDTTIFRNGSLVKLPYAQEEAQMIQKQFSHKSLNTKLLIDEAASKENFIENAQKYDILHLATHGYSFREDPYQSRIFFSEYQKNMGNQYMMMNELYNLSLNADLVVLSACNSGKGKIIEGEGMLALPGGFLYSGVPNVLASLWKVHDEKTKELMVAFYKNLLEDGVTYAEALRRAKLDCIEKGYLPLDWAGFVLIGS